MAHNHYETVFILTPVLSDAQIKDAVKKITTFLQDKGAQVVAHKDIGLRKLAYPIKKHHTGIYQTIEFTGPPTSVAELEIAYQRDEEVIRFLTTRLDKHGIAYHEAQREGKMKQETEEAAEVTPIPDHTQKV